MFQNPEAKSLCNQTHFPGFPKIRSGIFFDRNHVENCRDYPKEFPEASRPLNHHRRKLLRMILNVSCIEISTLSNSAKIELFFFLQLKVIIFDLHHSIYVSLFIFRKRIFHFFHRHYR